MDYSLLGLSGAAVDFKSVTGLVPPFIYNGKGINECSPFKWSNKGIVRAGGRNGEIKC